MTREDWLTRLVEEVRPWFSAVAFSLPQGIRVGCGWPSSRALSVTKRTLGECWDSITAVDGQTNIVISLALDDSDVVAGILMHELVHAATPGAGHKGEFVACCMALGLVGKPTQALPGPGLTARLATAITKLGRYPHGKVDGRARKKQPTRLLKLICPNCCYTVRTTQKWLDLGVPSCCCGAGEFIVEPPTEEAPEE